MWIIPGLILVVIWIRLGCPIGLFMWRELKDNDDE